MIARGGWFFPRGDHGGFTLIEVMMAVAIVAVLAVIAYPSYTGHVQKARRADAMDALLYIQHLQEKYRASNPQYGTLAQIGYPGATVTSGVSGQGHYTLTVTGNTAVGYTATAIATGTQVADAGCATLSILVSAANPRGDRQSTGGDICWRH